MAVGIAGWICALPSAAATLVVGPIELPQGPVATAVGLLFAHRRYVVIERWDAVRSGRLSRE
jgi:hypothetical protein